MKELNCMRCGCSMVFTASENISIGTEGWGSRYAPSQYNHLPVDIYVCPQCRKLEFFSKELSTD